MIRRLLALLPLVLVLELALLIVLGRVLGVGALVGIVLGTAVLGVGLARRQGARVLRTWQLAVLRGRVPREGLTSSALVLLGGVLLVMPGVLSDLAGLVLLVPPARRAIARVVSRRARQHLVHATFTTTTIGEAEREGAFIDVDATERELTLAPQPPRVVAIAALPGEHPEPAPAAAP